MAHCSSSVLHRTAFGADRSGHAGRAQGLLPPRKRLLAGPKHVAAGVTMDSLPSPSLLSPTATQSVHGENHGEAALAISGHALPPPPYSLLHSLSHKCFACGDSGVLLHRIPRLGGGGGYHCSSCVLSFNKQMYCFLCFQVFKEGSPSSSPSTFLTCCRCQRLSHVHCAHKLWSPTPDGAGLTLCIECYTRNNGSSSQSVEPPSKRRKTASFKRAAQQASSAGSKVKLPVIDQQALTAARVVAAIAGREALGAKQRAMAMARAAACTAAQAKIALDNAYDIAQKKREEEEEETCMAMDSASKDEGEKSGGNAMAKTPRGSKRRTLSAIVASETLSKELAIANPGSGLATTVKRKKKQRRPGSDDGVTGALSSAGAAAEATSGTSSLPSPSTAQSAKTSIKRRKTLSSLGLQNPTETYASAKSKGSKSSTAKTKRSSSSTKGKLGAIFSQVLALGKGSKSSSKALGKVRGSVIPSVVRDDHANDEVQQNTCKRDAITSSADTKSNTTLKLSQGHIASPSNIDACTPSHQDVAASYHQKSQDGRCLEATLENAETMRLGNSPTTAQLGMIQEQGKSRIAGDEAIASEQEIRLFNFLNRTLASSKLMHAKGVTTARVTQKR